MTVKILLRITFFDFSEMNRGFDLPEAYIGHSDDIRDQVEEMIHHPMYGPTTEEVSIALDIAAGRLPVDVHAIFQKFEEVVEAIIDGGQ